jgi:hypothetical protein
MNAFAKLRDVFKSLADGLGELIKQTFKDTEKDALDYNKHQLNEMGMKSNGELMREYSPRTLEIKRKEGTFISKHGLIALQNYGNFQDKMRFKDITAKYAEIDSTDSKNSELLSRYGSCIFGLIPEHEKEYAENEFLASFLKLIKDKLNEQN